MKRKTILTIILALSLLWLPTIKRSQAQDHITLAVDPPTYQANKKGDIFSINVTIDNVETDDRLVGLDFRLSYNNAILEVINVEEGPFFKQFNQTPSEPHTFFIYYIENETTVGTETIPPHVVVGILLYPNETGLWPEPFPEGNGTIATMTFKAIYQPVEPQPATNCTFKIFDTMLVDDAEGYLTCEVVSGYYEIPSALYPILSFTYWPPKPTAGQEVIFNASESYDPDGSIIWYCWEFEDGTTVNTTHPVATHVFSASGWHDVTLTAKGIDNLTSTMTKTVEVGAPAPIEVRIDAGSLYFRGEICEYNVLITHLGRAVNTKELSAMLYFEGNIYANLTENIETVETGFYRIPYTIQGTAEAGTYTLLVEAKYNEMSGVNIKSFYISDNLAGMKDTVDSIHNDILTVVIPDLGVIKLNLTEIHAVVTSISGTTATISTNVGDLTSDVSDLSDSILSLEGKVDDAVGTQGTMLTVLYVILILAIIAVAAAATAAYFARKT